jgi:tetratricopeptide (TPR) repeat protein
MLTMKPKILRAACLAAVLVAAAAPARAQLSEGWRLCIETMVIAPARAIRACTDLLETAPPTAVDRAMVYNIRGVAYKRAGDYERALADYNEAIRLAPGYSGFLVNRGNLYYARQDYARALADFDAAIRLASPPNPGYYFLRGRVYAVQKNYGDALADFEEALRLRPDDKLARYGRALARLGNGDPGGAADLTAVRAAHADIADAYARYAVTAK